LPWIYVFHNLHFIPLAGRLLILFLCGLEYYHHVGISDIFVYPLE
jgi:hypothetical protein